MAWFNLFTDDVDARLREVRAHNEAIKEKYNRDQREKQELMDKIDRILKAVEH